MKNNMINMQTENEQSRESNICKAVIISTSYGREDECSLCSHEHENWGENKYCRRCLNSYRG